jgi:hypothetical protein
MGEFQLLVVTLKIGRSKVTQINSKSQTTYRNPCSCLTSQSIDSLPEALDISGHTFPVLVRRWARLGRVARVSRPVPETNSTLG